MIFKKLKRKLLITYMIIISFIMLSALGAIYIITQNNVYSDIRENLFEARSAWRDVEEIIKENEIESEGEGLALSLQESGAYKRLPWHLRVSMMVRTDLDMNVLSILSLQNDSRNVFDSALAKDNIIVEGEFTYFKSNSKDWAVYTKLKDNNYTISLVDITFKIGILDKLIITCIIVFLSTLIVVFIVSWFLTQHAIKPVGIAFNKQKQFISDASHEFRTPMTAIKANADLIISHKKTQLGDDIKWLEYIKDETDRMKGLSDDMLYLAQLEGKYKKNKTEYKFDVSKLINKQILGMEALVYEKGLTIKKTIEDGLEMTGVKEELSQLAVILISNAIKYTDENGVIEINVTKNRNFLNFVVSNTGEGIGPDEINKVFDRFYMVDYSRERSVGSYGLGLSIAKAIVNNLDGTISCESSPEGLTIFTVKIKI